MAHGLHYINYGVVNTHYLTEITVHSFIIFYYYIHLLDVDIDVSPLATHIVGS